MNTERVRVVWLSPNTWVDGSRYGNVSFAFDWHTIRADYRAYWVEAMTEYRPHAPRILLTRSDYSGRLEPYDETGAIERGPWWRDPTGAHHWNGRYTLEFMLEDDLDLSMGREISFGQHHSTYCSENPQTCSQRGLAADVAAGRFIASLVAHGIQVPSGLLATGPLGQAQPRTGLKHGLAGIWDELERNLAGSAAAAAADAPHGALARALMLSIANQDSTECRQILNLFPSAKSVSNAVGRLIRSHFSLAPDAQLGVVLTA